MRYVWICGVCGKTIHGTRNTIHLAVQSHIKYEIKIGKRSPDKDTGYGDREGDLGTLYFLQNSKI
jgi:hypothetical protein